jgi:hypothetical protein
LQRLRLALLSRWPRRSWPAGSKGIKLSLLVRCLGAQRVAGFERDGARKLLDPRFKCICYPGEKPPSLARDRARPGAKGIGRGFHRACDVFGAAPRHLGDWAPVRRSSTSSHSSETLSTHLPPVNIRSFLSAASSSRIFVTAGFSSASLLLGPGPPAALRPHFENHIMLARVLDHL